MTTTKAQQERAIKRAIKALEDEGRNLQRHLGAGGIGDEKAAEVQSDIDLDLEALKEVLTITGLFYRFKDLVKHFGSFISE